MPEISIIMPVYNAERTVSHMIDSIMAQTFRDWELIAIDDGSTDGSGEILDKYAERDTRIKVVHKANGGVASARQQGIERATGIYTIHADSDDWVELSMLEEMLTIAKTECADIVIADYFTDIDSQPSKVTAQRPESFESLDVLYGLYSGNLFGGLWHKLIKRSVYDKASAHFYQGIDYCEDLLLLTQILTRMNLKIVYLPKAFYHYVANPSSLTQNVSVKGLESMRRFHREALVLLPAEHRFVKVKDTFMIKEFIVMFTNRLYVSKDELKKQYLDIKESLDGRYGFRWKAGFWCIEHGLTNIAHKLIKF